jgi:transposase
MPLYEAAPLGGVVCPVGLGTAKLRGVESIGVGEIHWGRGKRAGNFLTVIYQIDAGCRRLLWVGNRRSQATLRRSLKALGAEVVKGLRFVCSDMWKPYLQVIRRPRPTSIGRKEIRSPMSVNTR